MEKQQNKSCLFNQSVRSLFIQMTPSLTQTPMNVCGPTEFDSVPGVTSTDQETKTSDSGAPVLTGYQPITVTLTASHAE